MRLRNNTFLKRKKNNIKRGKHYRKNIKTLIKKIIIKTLKQSF